MFRSLRSRLIFSYVSLILLVLTLTGGAAGIIIADGQRDVVLQRINSNTANLLLRLTPLTTKQFAPAAVLEQWANVQITSSHLLFVAQDGKIVTGPFPEIDLGDKIPVPAFSPYAPGLGPPPLAFRTDKGSAYYAIYVWLEPYQQDWSHASYLVAVYSASHVDLPWGELIPPLAIILC